MSDRIITREHLREHKDEIFVFGDNCMRNGYGGAAALRDEYNTYGFITKLRPDNADDSFFKPTEYEKIYEQEMRRLLTFMCYQNRKLFLISKIGAGLANRHHIFENVINVRIHKDLENTKNYVLLWED